MVQKILFRAEVEEAHVKQLVREVNLAIQRGVKHVYIWIDSPGGKISWGLRAAAMLKSVQPGITVTTHNVSQCDSAANLIFASGSIRYATSRSTFFFHEVVYRATSDRALRAIDLFAFGDLAADFNDRFAGTYAAYTNLSQDFVWNLMTSETILTAQEASDYSIVHEIRDADSLSIGESVIIANGFTATAVSPVETSLDAKNEQREM